MKQKIVLIASVVIGLLAAVLTRSYLNAKDNEYAQRRQQLEEGYAKIAVLAAKRDLPSGTVLTRDDLGEIDMIEKAVRGTAIRPGDYLMLVGRKTVTKLERGTVVQWSHIEGGGPDMKGLSGDIKEKMRAFSVNASGAATVSGMVQPNDHVDVLGTFTLPSKTVPGEMELMTQTILQDVLVLATGKETAKSRLFAGSAAASAYSTVTLEVTPREAEMLAFLDAYYPTPSGFERRPAS